MGRRQGTVHRAVRIARSGCGKTYLPRRPEQVFRGESRCGWPALGDHKTPIRPPPGGPMGSTKAPRIHHTLAIEPGEDSPNATVQNGPPSCAKPLSAFLPSGWRQPPRRPPQAAGVTVSYNVDVGPLTVTVVKFSLDVAGDEARGQGAHQDRRHEPRVLRIRRHRGSRDPARRGRAGAGDLQDHPRPVRHAQGDHADLARRRRVEL